MTELSPECLLLAGNNPGAAAAAGFWLASCNCIQIRGAMPGAGLLHPLEQCFLTEHTQLGLQLLRS